MCREKLDELRAQRSGLAREIEERNVRLADLDADIAARDAALASVDARGYQGLEAEVALAVVLAGGDEQAMTSAASAVAAPAVPVVEVAVAL